jgi:hypothetical protein
VNLFPWAVIAQLVPMVSGSYLSLGGGRPDAALAFMIAGSVRRHPPLVLVGYAGGLCGVRLFLSPPDALGECAAFAAVALIVLGATRVRPVKGVFPAALVVAGSYGSFAALTVLCQKGLAGVVAVPPTSALLVSVLMTGGYAAAFGLLIPQGREGGQVLSS